MRILDINTGFSPEALRHYQQPVLVELADLQAAVLDTQRLDRLEGLGCVVIDKWVAGRRTWWTLSREHTEEELARGTSLRDAIDKARP